MKGNWKKENRLVPAVDNCTAFPVRVIEDVSFEWHFIAWLVSFFHSAALLVLLLSFQHCLLFLSRRKRTGFQSPFSPQVVPKMAVLPPFFPLSLSPSISTQSALCRRRSSFRSLSPLLPSVTPETAGRFFHKYTYNCLLISQSCLSVM